MLNTDPAIIKKLKSIDKKKSVIIFGATSINFWYYYPIVRQFSVDELQEFKAVYGISGGSAPFWLYTLARRDKLINETLFNEFDRDMKHCLNRYNILKKISCIKNNEYIYFVEDLIKLMSTYIQTPGVNYTFKDFNMKNYHVIGHDIDKNKLIIFSKKNTPDAIITHAISGSVFPRYILNRKFCKGSDKYPYISDFEFADKEVKTEFHKYLNKVHGNDDIYYINLFKTEKKENIQKIKISKNKSPQIEQLVDLSLAFLNLSNSNYRKTFNTNYELIGDLDEQKCNI